MGAKDLAEKNLLQYKDVFSDIVNVNLFGGRCYKPPRRKSGVPMKRGLKNGSARMPPVLRRKYAGRQNRHAVRQKRNV